LTVKIALVSKAIYPARGGVELHVHSLAQELAELGHDIHAFTANSPRHESRPNGYFLNSGIAGAGLYMHLKRGGFDAVHAHGARTPVASWALLIGKRIGLRTVFTPHCFYPAQSRVGAWKRWMFDPTLGKLSLRRADRVICLTENDRQDAIRHGAPVDAIRVVPNSIRWPQPVDENKVEDFRRRHGLGKFLLSVGRLDRVKRGDFLISALPHLPEDLHLVLIGPDAGCGRSWRQFAAELGVSARARFISEVSDQELQLAYRASQAVVMASAYEGLPTVLLEAMAAGVPVIAAKSGGITYLLQHGVNGLLYDGGDLHAFCDHVTRTLDEFPEAMVRAAQRLVREHYCWKVNAGRVAALYRGDDH
jgi:glycosyltransferase involved in cell wall biosynthesis